jgi:hypothetical protein
MKKILVVVLVFIATSTAAFALTPEDYGVFYKLNNESTFEGLINYLNADKEQTNYLKQVFEVTADELKNASKNSNKNIVEDVLNYNLYNSKCILSEKQYKKYLIFINLSINNKSKDLVNVDNLISEVNK